MQINLSYLLLNENKKKLSSIKVSKQEVLSETEFELIINTYIKS